MKMTEKQIKEILKSTTYRVYVDEEFNTAHAHDDDKPDYNIYDSADFEEVALCECYIHGQQNNCTVCGCSSPDNEYNEYYNDPEGFEEAYGEEEHITCYAINGFWDGHNYATVYLQGSESEGYSITGVEEIEDDELQARILYAYLNDEGIDEGDDEEEEEDIDEIKFKFNETYSHPSIVSVNIFRSY